MAHSDGLPERVLITKILTNKKIIMLAKAIHLAAEAFKETKDKGGKPYILHCLRVMNSVDPKDEELMCAAVLHDLIEDRPDKYTFQKLHRMGFSERVVSTIAILTHDKAVSDYDNYIKAIAMNKDATVIKLADLKDNSDFTRLKGVRKKDFDRMEKYQKAFIYLSNQ